MGDRRRTARTFNRDLVASSGKVRAVEPHTLKLSTVQAAETFGKFMPRPPSPTTVSKWMRSGTRGGLRLEGVRMPGGRWATTEDAIIRFLEACQCGQSVHSQPTPIRSNTIDSVDYRRHNIGA
jgi:hypothetical protein